MSVKISLCVQPQNVFPNEANSNWGPKKSSSIKWHGEKRFVSNGPRFNALSYGCCSQKMKVIHCDGRCNHRPPLCHIDTVLEYTRIHIDICHFLLSLIFYLFFEDL